MKKNRAEQFLAVIVVITKRKEERYDGKKTLVDYRCDCRYCAFAILVVCGRRFKCLVVWICVSEVGFLW